MLIALLGFTGCTTHEARFNCKAECEKKTLECSYNGNRIETDLQ